MSERTQKPRSNLSIVATALALISIIFTAGMEYSKTDISADLNTDKLNAVVNEMEEKFEDIDNNKNLLSTHEIRLTNVEKQNEVAGSFQRSIRESIQKQEVTSREIQTDIKYIKEAINELKDRK